MTDLGMKMEESFIKMIVVKKTMLINGSKIMIRVEAKRTFSNE